MKFFVDTAEVKEIRDLLETDFLDGVTTNPSLIAKSGCDFKEVVAEICRLTDTPVSAEVSALDTPGMIAEGENLAQIAPNVVVKLPLTMEGLRACAHFKRAGIPTNVTLCFSANQALLAAKAGATYVSPFIGRLDDINLDGTELIEDIRAIYDNYGIETEIIAASIRSPNHVTRAALAGSDIATIPPNVIRSLVQHPLTDKGLSQFLKDWSATGQSIL
ncbi:MAG: fructose-6-phosphate aldolase [Dinoroseobacter sp.]|nr:fructose-6-phosphate aldolase [Dinoroseobacter sp.]MDJ0994023.1 fructose-6-phosphate aldolase [Dinoroseobacter sp.]